MSRFSSWSCVLLLASCAGGIGAEQDPGGMGGTGVPGMGGTGGTKVMPVAVPGRLTLRRLNKDEYNNTVRDLLKTAKQPANAFPEDQAGDGFDTVGEALSFSADLVAALEVAASDLVDELVARPPTDPVRMGFLPCDAVSARNDACARQIITGFAQRAFRRPVQPDEATRLFALWNKVAAAPEVVTAPQPQSFGLKAALMGVLMAPPFLFHLEMDPNPNTAALHPLTAFEFASRLSYFLNATMPDPALYAEAESGALLRDPMVLKKRVDALLGNLKTLSGNFATQWLNFDDIDELNGILDPRVFPMFATAANRNAITAGMKSETLSFFSSLVTEAKPVETFLTADYTFLNGRLATLYGMSAPANPNAMTRTPTTGTPRVGFLTQGSFLFGTSDPSRGNTVRRGAFVLSRMMCTPPPPPPADVPPLEAAKVPKNATARQRLAVHENTAPDCRACHLITDMDAYGLSFENFDGVGAYRTMENGSPIDTAVTLADGKTMLNGPRDLTTYLAQDGRFAPCVTRNLLTYGLGWKFSADEGPAYATWLASLARDRGNSMRSILDVIIESEAFRTRRGEAP